MSTIPSISSSAQSLISDGFTRLNGTAVSLAFRPVSPANFAISTSNSTVSTPFDPLLGGVSDLFSARQQVGAGTVLLETSGKLLDALTDSLGHHVDQYA